MDKEIQNTSDRTPLHIGLDDTDSPTQGCTTHIASEIIQFIHAERKLKNNFIFMDYPNLIRLNPNIPFRTRGNGAIAIRLQIKENLIEYLFTSIKSLVNKNAALNHPNTQPGLIFYKGQIPHDLQKYSVKAISEIISRPHFENMYKKLGTQTLVAELKGGRGLIGALAAIGYLMTERDHTFELIAYRHPRFYGKPRQLEAKSIFKMNTKTFPNTFANIDTHDNEILIAPHGSDPVLFGIRGNSAQIVYDAYAHVISKEPINQWCIFRTNQATNQHLSKPVPIASIYPYMPVQVIGRITSDPVTIKGGHVFTEISDSTGSVTLAAYEPTGKFRDIIRQLCKNDEVKAVGSVRPASSQFKITINLEAIQLLKLHPKYTWHPPKCPNCQKTMTSDGTAKGYKCLRCKTKHPDLTKQTKLYPRQIALGYYVTPPSAFRHLTKPLERYGHENSGYELSNLPATPPWHS